MPWPAALEVLGLFSRCLYSGVEGMSSVGKGGKNLLAVFLLNIKKKKSHLLLISVGLCNTDPVSTFLCPFVPKNNIAEAI